MAGGADGILVPERPFDVDAVCAQLHRRHQRGRSFSIIVVAEGARPQKVDDQSEHTSRLESPASAHPGGIATMLQYEIEARTGYETRATILGHVQRGGTPIAYDRILATRFGTAATDAVLAGRFGTMTALAGTEVLTIDLEQALQSPKSLDLRLYETAAVFFG
jgi:6-phosphofructokinase